MTDDTYRLDCIFGSRRDEKYSECITWNNSSCKMQKGNSRSSSPFFFFRFFRARQDRQEEEGGGNHSRVGGLFRVVVFSHRSSSHREREVRGRVQSHERRREGACAWREWRERVFFLVDLQRLLLLVLVYPPRQTRI